MKVTHLHKHGGLIGHTKTSASLCGKRVSTETMAQNGEPATCPACRAIRKQDHEGILQILARAQEIAPHTQTTLDVQALADKGVEYTNFEILR